MEGELRMGGADNREPIKRKLSQQRETQRPFAPERGNWLSILVSHSTGASVVGTFDNPPFICVLGGTKRTDRHVAHMDLQP